MGKNITIKTRVSEEFKQAFIEAAAAKGLSESAAVTMLAQQFVDQQRKIKLRNTETMEALADVQAGLAVEGDKVMSWIGSWGSSDEEKAPL